MTETKTQTRNHKPYIPTREEFHRLDSGIISAADFNTGGCKPGQHIKRILGSYSFDKTLEQLNAQRELRKKEANV